MVEQGGLKKRRKIASPSAISEGDEEEAVVETGQDHYCDVPHPTLQAQENSTISTLTTPGGGDGGGKLTRRVAAQATAPSGRNKRPRKAGQGKNEGKAPKTASPESKVEDSSHILTPGSDESEDGQGENLTVTRGRKEMPAFFWACRFCQREFGYSESRDRHLLTHAKDKPYACRFPSCTEMFSEEEDLSEHVKKTHVTQTRHVPKYEGDTSFSTNRLTRSRSYFVPPPSLSSIPPSPYAFTAATGLPLVPAGFSNASLIPETSESAEKVAEPAEKMAEPAEKVAEPTEKVAEPTENPAYWPQDRLMGYARQHDDSSPLSSSPVASALQVPAAPRAMRRSRQPRKIQKAPSMKRGQSPRTRASLKGLPYAGGEDSERGKIGNGDQVEGGEDAGSTHEGSMLLQGNDDGTLREPLGANQTLFETFDPVTAVGEVVSTERVGAFAEMKDPWEVLMEQERERAEAVKNAPPVEHADHAILDKILARACVPSDEPLMPEIAEILKKINLPEQLSSVPPKRIIIRPEDVVRDVQQDLAISNATILKQREARDRARALQGTKEKRSEPRKQAELATQHKKLAEQQKITALAQASSPPKVGTEPDTTTKQPVPTVVIDSDTEPTTTVPPPNKPTLPYQDPIPPPPPDFYRSFHDPTHPWALLPIPTRPSRPPIPKLPSNQTLHTDKI
ncbi:hypothetical protein LTR62_004666 [Meristemomyces frigidus]|uniref:C2H2-type domain-containing protein n=1 Tax=Meristemomyces frigidus TaxID=1508187 RepID=A0AAN7TF81_9PEZI|nr:hypothetical protein LTR62_004666 [Meristemomyces frigidus]